MSIPFKLPMLQEPSVQIMVLLAHLLPKESKPFSNEEFAKKNLQEIYPEKETVSILQVCLVQQ
jgi:hypothetical protein